MPHSLQAKEHFCGILSEYKQLGSATEGLIARPYPPLVISSGNHRDLVTIFRNNLGSHCLSGIYVTKNTHQAPVVAIKMSHFNFHVHRLDHITLLLEHQNLTINQSSNC